MRNIMASRSACASPEFAGTAPVRWSELVTLAGFCAFFFFFGLGSVGLTGADEPRYAQVAREMLARHDWITPTLGGQPWLEKPPLYYWGAMLSFRAFGVSDWAARVPSGILATALVFAVYGFMRRFRPGSQLDAGLMSGSCAAVIAFGRGASTDMPLAATFAIAMLGWYGWRETERKLYLVGFYGFIGLGMLAKGPVAPFLAFFIILIYAVIARDARLMLRAVWLPGILLFCAVVLPWYLAVQRQNPEFFRVFFLQHNVARFATGMFRHPGPIWYYAPVLLLSVLPWTVFVMLGLVRSVQEWLGPGPGAISPEPAFPVFLLTWAAIPFVFFTLAESKLPGYILPVAPACAMMAAELTHRRLLHGERTHVAVMTLHAMLSGALLACVLLSPYFMLHARPPAPAMLIAIVFAAIIAAGTFISLYRHGLRVLRFVTLAPLIVGLAFLLRLGAPAVDAVHSARPLARELEGMQTTRSETAVFHAPREVEYGLAFYREQAIRNYDRGEIPAVPHLLVARQGSQQELQRLLAGRRVSRLGRFAPQELEYFWVSNPSATGHEHPH
ncbi:MAG TPA: glycosyltransferase family 39 protein [Burkholderiales bacterium]|jgi:4-amino-4-deoxy-L-arabinose transferase-like glycosyltransferase|nr:glycosyltransferase family 39 protein [Burkholderiales bacterium]